jgi:hypothetical protein
MPTLMVQPRETPGERADAPVRIEVDEALLVHAAELEEWAATMEHWELVYRQGHDFDRPNNVEARLVFAGPAHTCSLVFRLDQLDGLQALGHELWLTLEEREGIAKAVHLAPTGLDVEFFHIVGPPLGGTPA